MHEHRRLGTWRTLLALRPTCNFSARHTPQTKRQMSVWRAEHLQNMALIMSNAMHNRRVWPNTELDASSQNHDAALHLLQYFLICDHE